MAQADNLFRVPPTLPSGSSDTGETEQLLNSHDLPWEDERSARTSDDTDYLTSTKNGVREVSLCCDEGDKPELASAEPALQPPNNQDWIEFRHDIGAHCSTNPEEGRGPVHPLVPDSRGEQEKDGLTMPPPAQERRASIPRFSDDKPSMQLSTGQKQVSQPSASHRSSSTL